LRGNALPLCPCDRLQGHGDGEALLRQRPRSGSRLAGERHPGRTAGCSSTPRTRAPASSPLSPSVPFRRSGLPRVCRRQEHHRARPWDRQERHGKAALVVGRRPRSGYAGPDVPCVRLLHVISHVGRWRVAGVHGAPSRLCERDSPAGWRGKHGHLRPRSLPRKPMECGF